MLQRALTLLAQNGHTWLALLPALVAACASLFRWQKLFSQQREQFERRRCLLGQQQILGGGLGGGILG